MLLFWQIWRGLYATTARPQFARFRSSIGRSSAATPDSSRDWSAILAWNPRSSTNVRSC